MPAESVIATVPAILYKLPRHRHPRDGAPAPATVSCHSITRPEMPSHNGMLETPEMELSQSLLVCAWIALHLAGLLIGWATRLAVGSRFDLFAQLAFFAALTILGGAAWFSHQQELGLWIPTGITMAGMVLMAVTDLRPSDVAADERFGASY